MHKRAIKKFRSTVWAFYRAHGRTFAWRTTTTPYHIVVSEIMLQQTQVGRVSEKFPEFIKKFSNWRALADAQTADILAAWSGLGYNRRALYLKRIAEHVTQEYGGALPADPALLTKLPGIGANTAGSIAAFAFDAPAVFIETNIRAVFLHHFFPQRTKVADKKLLPLIAETLDTAHPREWYWALMDYGTHLKKMHHNPARRSAHYTIQKKFEGSHRQVRGEVLKKLLSDAPYTTAALSRATKKPVAHIKTALSELVREGFVTRRGAAYSCR